MAVTFIYDDTSRAPKAIDIDVSAKKVKASGTVSSLQVQSIVVLYSHGGVRDYGVEGAKDERSLVVLANGAGTRVGLAGGTLAARFERWFGTLKLSARNKVKEIHLMSCNSGYEAKSAVATLATCPVIKTTFPSLEWVVGVQGIIDQDNDSKGIRLKAGTNVLGYSKEITKNGLPKDTPGVVKAAVP